MHTDGVIQVSAKERMNLDGLLEQLQLQASGRTMNMLAAPSERVRPHTRTPAHAAMGWRPAPAASDGVGVCALLEQDVRSLRGTFAFVTSVIMSSGSTSPSSQADLLDLKANPDRPAAGVVVEARQVDTSALG